MLTPSLTDCEIKRTALAWARLHPDAPAVLLNNLFADGEANARTGILAAGMQTLKDLKKPPGLGRVDADAVIAHGKPPVMILLLGRDVNTRRLLWSAEFQRIADEVLQHLLEPRGVSLH